jgi:hypothetical protein
MENKLHTKNLIVVFAKIVGLWSQGERGGRDCDMQGANTDMHTEIWSENMEGKTAGETVYWKAYLKIVRFILNNS